MNVKTISALAVVAIVAAFIGYSLNSGGPKRVSQSQVLQHLQRLQKSQPPLMMSRPLASLSAVLTQVYPDLHLLTTMGNGQALMLHIVVL